MITDDLRQLTCNWVEVETWLSSGASHLLLLSSYSVWASWSEVSTWSFMLNLLFQTDFLRRCSLWFSFSLSRLTSTCLLVNTRSCSFSLMLSSWKEKNCIFILLYIKALILKESNTSCWNPTGDYCEVNWWSEAAYLQLGGVGDTALF